MNRLFGILVAVCMLSAFTVDAQAKVGIKVGAGLSFGEGTFLNANMSINIPAFSEYTAISPFVDVFWHSTVTYFAGGVNVVWHFGEDDTGIYAGGGLGGVGDSAGEEAAAVISAIGGTGFGSRFFVQGRYLYFTSGTSNFTLQVGVSF